MHCKLLRDTPPQHTYLTHHFFGFILFSFLPIGHEPNMVYLPPRGSFVDHNFLKAQCLRSILQHVSPLAVGALRCNSLL